MNTLCRGLDIAIAGCLALMLLHAPPASAQTFPGCTSRQATDGNLVVRCRHVTIEIERGADLKLPNQHGSGAPPDAELNSGAIYIDDVSKAGRSRFQVQTPDAVASVRGTSWAVDVTPQRSSVFVAEGAVSVSSRSGGEPVTLTSGEGVDVVRGSLPLVVKRWPAERVRALLARFGR